MIKVYFDNNVYRLLAKEENNSLQRLLKNHKNTHLLFLYSQAHVNDLHQDKSNRKFDDLKFMDELVDDNFLLHESDDDAIVNKLVRPTEAYKYFSPDDDSIESVMVNAFNGLEEDPELKEILSPWISLLKSIPIDIGLSDITPEQDPDNILGRLGLDQKPKSLYDWMPQFGRMMDNLKSDNSIIKDVRRLSKKMLQVEKFNVNINDVNFDESISETPLGMSFHKLLEETVNNMTEQEKKNSRYIKYTMAFSMLNFLGLDKEKNKKVKYLNTHHDGEHFFYSTLADWVVSDDRGFRNKAKFLTNLFQIDLEIMTFDQFKFRFNQMVINKYLNPQVLIESIFEEIENGIVTSSRLDIKKLQRITVTKLRRPIMQFFNRASHVMMTDGSGESYVVMYKDGRKIYHYNWYKDFHGMTNRLVELLGNDNYGEGLFDEEDQKTIEDEKWHGREWTVGKTRLMLAKNTDTHRMNLIFGPFLEK
ncbi:hypothetical protein [Lewinella sp. 4G2]|uniref:hypothetical protein n=1 Tax=Lewinella sp. 4G2 TaxID=1803372 RepID=UPI0012FCFBB4|nr:hypothetical protein [Lewinella sp. 4G2]